MSNDATQYPERDKLDLVKDKTQAIGEFLDWLGYEKDIQLARVDTDGIYLTCESWLDLLAEWAGIDRDRLEAEKLQMLDQLRAANER